MQHASDKETVIQDGCAVCDADETPRRLAETFDEDGDKLIYYQVCVDCAESFRDRQDGLRDDAWVWIDENDADPFGDAPHA